MENKKINKKVLWIFLGFLLIFFGILIFLNEYTLFSGEEVFLETQPVDPRDFLRGDYVILSYKIENNSKLQDFIIENDLETGDDLYLVLERDQKNIASLSKISLDIPKDQFFLRATVGERSPFIDGYSIDMGISKYFVPEGRGREVEMMSGELDVYVFLIHY